MNYKLFIYILITLFFFSTSSVIARAAFVENLIDAYSFTFFRLLSGSAVLIFLLYLKEKNITFNKKENWLSSFFLFLYAICFSYSYLNLDAGIGALILFAIVQLLIIFWAIIKKESLTIQKGLGIAIAFGGLIYLLYPNKEIELSVFHVILMVLAGIAWGFYTILGRTCKNPINHTADNFTKAVLFAVVFYLLFVNNIYLTLNGILLAFLSGGITSALGYALWYLILPKIKIVTSGILQLLVPPIAIFLGVLLLNEEFTFKLLLATTTILLGIAIAIINKKEIKN